jgi:predicted alpha/beta hydrolase family esterase
MTREATVLIVPGLRDHGPEHCQTLLASRLPRVRGVTPIGRDNLDCLARIIEAIEEAAASIDGTIVIVAHSGGVIAVTHWARLTRRAVRDALLAAPADFDRPLPEGYPSLGLVRGGWPRKEAHRALVRSGLAARPC